MGEPARWQERVEEFVLGQVGDPPGRVLEVGCGAGELAQALARADHFVTAIGTAILGPAVADARREAGGG